MGNSRIRRIGVDGIITTIAGNGTEGFAGDGGPAAQAALGLPRGVAVDPSGTIYIADSYNHRIRRVDAKGIIITITGSGTKGFGGDGGPAIQAILNLPAGIDVDANGTIYIAEPKNHRIRRVAPLKSQAPSRR
jgi:sugar lactone lactonase YvrE